MASVNVDKMSLKDLVDLEAKVKKALSAARERERSEIKQKIENLAQNSGFSVSELFGGRGRGRPAKGRIAAKFVNPDNPAETWAGRGRSAGRSNVGRPANRVRQ